MQNMEGTASPEVTSRLKANIQERHGKDIKAKGADVLSWANDQSGKALADTGVGRMSDNELAGQHLSTLEKMVARNEVEGDQARSMLSDPRVNANLTPEQKGLLTQAAGGDLRPAPSKSELDQAHQDAINENARRPPI